MMARIGLIIAALMCLALAACGGGGTSPIPEAKADVPRPLIVVVGDSISAAYMPGDGARNRLAPELAYTKELRAIGPVVTAAVGGATTRDALNNQTYWLAPLAPRVVVILLGTNDAVLGMDRAQALANVDAIAAAWPGAKVVLVSPPRWSDKADPWMSAWSQDLQRLALQRNAWFVDAYRASFAGWQCHPEDGHPCEPGHREMGRMVASAVQSALAAP